jgi:hypothetical protein
MFRVSPGAYLLVEQLKGDSLWLALAFLTHIRSGRKSLPGTNTLAYYEPSYIMDVKFFIPLGL